MEEVFYPTKQIETTDGLILIACVAFDDASFNQFREVFFPREGYGILRLESMKQVDNNEFGIPEAIVVPDDLILEKSDKRIITVTKDKSKIADDIFYLSNETKEHIKNVKGEEVPVSYIEDTINRVSCDALQRKKQALLESKTEELKSVLNSKDGIDIDGLLALYAKKDTTTLGHVKTVAQLAEVICDGVTSAFGDTIILSEQQRENFITMAFVHDIGKIITPDQLLKNAGAFVGKEFSEMQRHIEINCELAENQKTRELLNIALKHHYKYDGSGYPSQPENERRENIPIEARMLAVIDSFDAITDPNRVYQPKPDAESKLVDAINIMYNNCHEKTNTNKSGGQFDPKMSYAFLVSFKDKIIYDIKFRNEWINREGLANNQEECLNRATRISTFLDNNITKLEEEFGFGQSGLGTNENNNQNRR